MKKLIIGFFMLTAVHAKSQSIIDSLGNISFTMQDTVAEKLAQLALAKNPTLAVTDKQIEAELSDLQRSKVAWTNNIVASFNLNEGNLNPSSTGGANLFFPRHNINVGLPLGLFFTRSKDIKKARAEYEGSIVGREIEVNQLKQQIKTAYQNYQAAKYLLTLQDAVLQDEAILLSQVQDKFEKNTVSLEIFTNANKRYNLELVRRVTLLRDVNVAKITLESLLGMDLQTAMAAIAAVPSQ